MCPRISAEDCRCWLRAPSQNNQAHHANAQGTKADETQDALATEIGGLGEVGPADLEAVEALLSIRENPLQTGRMTGSVVGIETADIEAALILMGLHGDYHQKMTRNASLVVIFKLFDPPQCDYYIVRGTTYANE